MENKKVDLHEKQRLTDGLICPNSDVKLTNSEQDVLDLITKEFLTLQQIQIRRQCSKQAVYKIVKKLREKGVLNNGLQKVDYFQCTSQPNRLHGQELNIKIISKSNKYLEILNKSNLIFKDGHTLRLYKDSIEIYAGEGISFFGETESRATSKSLDYWKKFIVGLENEFKVILLKNRVQNIKLVNHHYATINSKVSKDSTGNDTHYRVYSDVDGKLIFLTDNSFNLKEHETVHPIDSKIHSENVNKQINDWCNNNPPTNSELTNNLNKLIELQIEEVKNRKEYSHDLVVHKEAIRTLSHEVKLLRKTFRSVIKENNELRLKNKHQKSLFDYYNVKNNL